MSYYMPEDIFLFLTLCEKSLCTAKSQAVLCNARMRNPSTSRRKHWMMHN